MGYIYREIMRFGATCIPIEMEHFGQEPDALTKNTFSTQKPGKYFLTNGILSERLISIPEGLKSANGSVGAVWSSNLEINLKGHLVASNSRGTWAIEAEGGKGEVTVARLAVVDGTLTSRAGCDVKAIHLVGLYFGSIPSVSLLFGQAAQMGELPCRTVYHCRVESPPTVHDGLLKPIKAMTEEAPAHIHAILACLLAMSKNAVEHISLLKGGQVRGRSAAFCLSIQALFSAARAPGERGATELGRIWTGRDRWAVLPWLIGCHIRELLGWQRSHSG